MGKCCLIGKRAVFSPEVVALLGLLVGQVSLFGFDYLIEGSVTKVDD